MIVHTILNTAVHLIIRGLIYVLCKIPAGALSQMLTVPHKLFHFNCIQRYADFCKTYAMSFMPLLIAL